MPYYLVTWDIEDEASGESSQEHRYVVEAADPNDAVKRVVCSCTSLPLQTGWCFSVEEDITIIGDEALMGAICVDSENPVCEDPRWLQFTHDGKWHEIRCVDQDGRYRTWGCGSHQHERVRLSDAPPPETQRCEKCLAVRDRRGASESSGGSSILPGEPIGIDPSHARDRGATEEPHDEVDTPNGNEQAPPSGGDHTCSNQDGGDCMLFPHSSAHTVSNLEFIAAWQMLGSLLGPTDWDWRQDAMPRNNRKEAFTSIINAGLCFGLDALCRCLVPNADTMQATVPFMEANSNIVTACTTVNPSSGQSVNGARLTETALREWDSAAEIDRARVMDHVERQLEPLLEDCPD